MKPSVKTAALVVLISCSIVVQLMAWIIWLPAASRGKRSDFGEFYTAGYCVRSGQSARIYDDATQQKIQKELIPGQKPEFIPYLHLPYEALLFAPLAGFGFRTAFFLFFGFGLCCAAISLYVLAGGKWSTIAVVAIVFIPLSVSAICGQDSLLLLLVLTISWLLLRRGNEGLAGLVAGIGLFRFQIIIPIVILFMLWKHWRFARGAAVSAAVVAMISLLMVGPRELGHYLQDVAGLAAGTGYSVVNNYGISLAGLAMTLGSGISMPVLRTLFVAACLLLMGWRFTRKPGTAQEALEWAIPAALLVGIHVHFYDAALLAISTVPSLAQRRESWPAWLLFASVPIAVLNPSSTFLLAVPLAIFALSQNAASLDQAALRSSPPAPQAAANGLI